MVQKRWLLILLTNALRLSAAEAHECPIVTNTTCADKNGIMDGGRCFFIVNENCTDWDDAWKRCQDHGGILAQMHSDSEFSKLVKHAKVKYAPLDQRYHNRVMFFIALKFDDGYFGAEACGDTRSNHVYWYDSPGDKSIPQMAASNTWLKCHICDDTDTDTAEIVFALQVDANGGHIKDIKWNAPRLTFPLCMLNSLDQRFTKSGRCMTEQALAKITKGNLRPQTCADECTKRLWCRSFNIKYVGGENGGGSSTIESCELFPWSYKDRTCAPAKTVAENQTCIYYNYEP